MGLQTTLLRGKRHSFGTFCAGEKCVADPFRGSLNFSAHFVGDFGLSFLFTPDESGGKRGCEMGEKFIYDKEKGRHSVRCVDL